MPLGFTQGALTAELGISRVAVNEIVNGRRSMTPATALRLAKAGTTPEFWLNGQISVDLYEAGHDEERLRTPRSVVTNGFELIGKRPAAPDGLFVLR